MINANYINNKITKMFFSTLGYSSPVLTTQEVVLVLPPESVHRRNLASRRASDAAEQAVGSDPPLGDGLNFGGSHTWGIPKWLVSEGNFLLKWMIWG